MESANCSKDANGIRWIGSRARSFLLLAVKLALEAQLISRPLGWLDVMCLLQLTYPVTAVTVTQ